MHHIKLLDCTLRDGGYLIDKRFGDNNIRGMINGLVDAGIDYIEIGFFQDEGFGEGKTVFKNAADAKRFVPEDKKNCKFTVLADYSRYSVSALDERREDSIDAVRECFFKHEREAAIEVCKQIKAKGYEVFVQPVDILGYTDKELIAFIEQINEVEPYCLSIVDTFGSMYYEDLQRVFEIIDHNLVSTCKIGFHSHNNMQMSSALSQQFVKLTYGKREGIIDSTISGMGRGAGNTPTELVAQYLVSQLGYNYGMDSLLDIIDTYMDNIRTRCTWGYTTQYFLAGAYGAHVNNIAFLTKKSSIRSKDIRFILNRVGSAARKRYDYDLLEKSYLDYMTADIDDSLAVNTLREKMAGRSILVLVPGSTVNTQKDRIQQYIEAYEPLVISTNFIHDHISADYIYMNNVKRYMYWKKDPRFSAARKIIVSNIKQTTNEPLETIISFNRLIKCGWEHMDNSTILLLRFLDQMEAESIAIAGFDGYSYGGVTAQNYYTPELEVAKVREEPFKLNDEISSMLSDLKATRRSSCPIRFVTDSRFSHIFEGPLS